MTSLNSTLELMRQRRSIRRFTGEKISDDDLCNIIQAAQQAPSSVNGQQISLIVVRDKGKIKKIAELAGGQSQVACADVFITLLIDFNRTAYAVSRGGAQQIVEQAAEGIIVGTFDAGIMLNALQTATISLGYGTTAIGGIRYYPEKMVRLLELPAKTYPIAGMTIGVIDRDHLPKTKPRVPVESFAMRERYDSQKVKDGVDTYDRQLRAWWDNQGLEKMKSYSASLAETYTTNRYYKIASTLANQGFIFK